MRKKYFSNDYKAQSLLSDIILKVPVTPVVEVLRVNLRPENPEVPRPCGLCSAMWNNKLPLSLIPVSINGRSINIFKKKIFKNYMSVPMYGKKFFPKVS